MDSGWDTKAFGPPILPAIPTARRIGAAYTRNTPPLSPLGFSSCKTVGQSDPSATCTPSCWDGVQQQTGPLPPLLSFASEHHANTFEVYADDLLLALDPMYPGYNEYHTQYEHALQAVHTGIGSSVTLSPTSLQFEEYAAGYTSTPETIAVINSGSSDLTIHGVSVVGDFRRPTIALGKTQVRAAMYNFRAIHTHYQREDRRTVDRRRQRSLDAPNRGIERQRKITSPGQIFCNSSPLS